MDAEKTEQGSGKTKRRSSGKATKPQAGVKVKATVHLSMEASQRLSIHAAMMGMDRSELGEKLIVDHLRRFVVSDRGGDGAGAGESAA